MSRGKLPPLRKISTYPNTNQILTLTQGEFVGDNLPKGFENVSFSQ